MRNLKTGNVVAEATSDHCFIDRAGRPVMVKKAIPEMDAVLKEILNG